MGHTSGPKAVTAARGEDSGIATSEAKVLEKFLVVQIGQQGQRTIVLDGFAPVVVQVQTG